MIKLIGFCKGGNAIGFCKGRNRFGIKNVVWVTDRGILTNNKINELVKSVEGLDFITGLKKNLRLSKIFE